MKKCPICGNTYADDRSRCPFCLTEDRPDFKTIPLTSAAKKILFKRFKWAEAKRKEYYFYADWIDLDDERLIKPFFTDRPTPFRLLRKLIKGTFSFLFSCITHFLSIAAYFTLYVFCSLPIYKLIALGSVSKAEFTEIGLTYTALLLIPSIFAGTGPLTPLPIRLWNSLCFSLSIISNMFPYISPISFGSFVAKYIIGRKTIDVPNDIARNNRPYGFSTIIRIIDIIYSVGTVRAHTSATKRRNSKDFLFSFFCIFFKNKYFLHRLTKNLSNIKSQL